MGISYSVDADPDTTAKAMLRERQMSHKHSKAIAREIKGMTAEAAVAYLEDVIEGDRSVPFKSHNSGVGHRNDIEGWDAGRYPEKASEAFIDLLENAIGNAEYAGMDGESMEIVHVAAHKVGEQQGRQPRAMGRANEWNTPEVDVELILSEASASDSASGDSREQEGDA
ncbi:Ribosomal protein L22 [Halorhabdus sp. SVX81]|uniref:50S ribosomal protein L22 n=1 Tax=Halorhabdus sp. SVX81 TaxID=2978283 RepID=UPI0023DC9084|nr:50S ribosomal protein L22 [Halorhabdus sp. SVX81]WEL18428.1 Ribosomal protein L22 [Halorhabdus sp. SVX81]